MVRVSTAVVNLSAAAITAALGALHSAEASVRPHLRNYIQNGGPLACSPTSAPHQYMCDTGYLEFSVDWNGGNSWPYIFNVPRTAPQIYLLPGTANSYHWGRETHNVTAQEQGAIYLICEWETRGSGRLWGPGGYVNGHCFQRASDLPPKSRRRHRHR